MGIALAVVGLLVLGTAAFFILRDKGTPPSPPPKIAGKGGPAPAPMPQPDPPTADPIKPKLVEEPIKPKVVVQPAQAPLSADLTNLLPNDTDHVIHIPFRVLFSPDSTVRDALFQSAP